ncbi:PhnE/PtxC family ABC transporter permease [Yersinia enterocolitica]
MNTDFNHYYQRVRAKQKRETLIWSLTLVIIYLGAGSIAEFNLHTVFISIPYFFDYLVETIPVLHWHKLLADGHTEGSLAYWGYRLPIQLPLIWETLQLAVASTILSVMVAIILAFLALALHTIGSLTKLFYESLETASDKPVRGLAACGAGKLQRMRFALWPQVKPIFLSYSFMRLEINFRQSTILGLVGAGGIGQELITSIKLDRYDQVSMTLLLIIIVVSLLDYTSGKLRKRVVEGVHNAK